MAKIILEFDGVEEAQDANELLIAVKSPKSVAFPAVVMIMY